MKILITGADGFLGSNIVRELLSKEYVVKAFIHNKSTSKTIQDLPIETIYGDLLDYESVNNAMQNVDVVIHAAASTKTWPTRCETHEAVNIEGTTNIVKAAINNNIKRLIYVGTANTFGAGKKDNPGTENNPYLSSKYKLGYMDSKYKAHLIVQDAVKHGLQAITVNPTFMFGPYDSGPSSGAMIMAIYKRKVPGYTKGGKNYIAVKDVAVGVCNALIKGRIGESYILGNVNLSYKDAFTLIAEIINSKAPKIFLPPLIVKCFAIICFIQSWITGKEPNITYPMAQISGDDLYYSAEKAISELDLPQTPISIAIKEAYEWFKINNKLK